MTSVACGGPAAIVCTGSDGSVDSELGIGGSTSIELRHECEIEGYDPDVGLLISEAMFFASPQPKGNRLTFVDAPRWTDLSASFPDVPEGGCAPLPEANYGPLLGLDAGAQLRLSGPEGTATLVRGVPAGTSKDTSYISVDDGKLFVPGGSYTLSAAGSADVGAFDVDIVAPDDFVVTRPPIADACGLDARSDRDLELRWTAPGSEARLVFALVGGTSGGTLGAWLCKFRNIGTGRVPAKVLSSMPKSDFGMEVFVYRTFEFHVPCVQGPVVGVFRIVWSYLLARIRPG